MRGVAVLSILCGLQAGCGRIGPGATQPLGGFGSGGGLGSSNSGSSGSGSGKSHYEGSIYDSQGCLKGPNGDPCRRK